jgi:hypothetical protein
MAKKIIFSNGIILSKKFAIKLLDERKISDLLFLITMNRIKIIRFIIISLQIAS